jgi:hypothetical protein
MLHLSYVRSPLIPLPDSKKKNLTRDAVFRRVDIEEDEVTRDEQHSAYKWIKEPTEDLHPYLREMITRSGIFE